MRPRHRSDEVAPAIVDALRQTGCRVVPFESPWPGEPDLLVGWVGRLTLLELKSPGGRLSDEQRTAHAAWARVGVKVETVRTPREALDAVGITGPRAEQSLAAMRLLVSERKRMHRAVGKLRPSIRLPGP
jgi:hypothetical protein